MKADDIFTNMGLLVSDQCKHSIKFAVFQGIDKLVFKANTHAQTLGIEDKKYLPLLRLFEKQKEITRSDVEEVLGVGTTHAVNTLKDVGERTYPKRG